MSTQKLESMESFIKIQEFNSFLTIFGDFGPIGVPLKLKIIEKLTRFSNSAPKN